MSFLDRFRKKKEKAYIGATQNTSELEQFCQDDRNAYEALNHVMFLDPRKILTTSEEAAETAGKLEREKNLGRARVWYDIAGGLAIYQGDPKKVAEYFSESERISGTKYPILNNTEKAVAKAQEYYKKYLKVAS